MENYSLLTKLLFLTLPSTLFAFALIVIFVQRKNYKNKAMEKGKLLKVDRNLLGKSFYPIRVFQLYTDLYPEKSLSKTIFIAEVAKHPLDLGYFETDFYEISANDYSVIKTSGCKEFRLTSRVIKPGLDELYFEAYSGMR